MNSLYAVIAHIMMVGAIIAMFILMFTFIVKASDTVEKTMRVLSIAGGLLIFFGAKTIGTDIPGLIFSSLDPTGGIVSVIISTIFPALAGVLVTNFLFKSINSNHKDVNRRIYFLILISTLITLTFTDIYLGSFSTDTEKINIGINISFITGIILTLLFRIDIVKSIFSYINPDQPEPKDESSNDPEETVPRKSWKDEY